MSTHRITTADLAVAFRRYVNACENLKLVPEGYSVGLEHGSKHNGIAYKVYTTGRVVKDADGTVTYSKGSGHSSPPAGAMFLGMTKREAHKALIERATTLEDVYYRKGLA